MRGSAGTFTYGIAPASLEWSGGIYQYSQLMLDVIGSLRASRDERFVVLGNGIGPRSPVLGGRQWQIAALEPDVGGRRLLHFASRFAQAYLSAKQRDALTSFYLRLRAAKPVPAHVDSPQARPDVRSWLEARGIDVVIYPAPMATAFESGVPYVFAVHDLQHRLQPEFPEVSADGEWERREYLFLNGIAGATMVLVDSEIGKQDVLDFYGHSIDADRVVALPFLPAAPADVQPEDRTRVRFSYDLPHRYLFYPAQFWPHKNHERLVEALGQLAREGTRVPLVLVGSAGGTLRKRTLERVHAAARHNGIEDLVRHLGYVPAEDLAPLYAEAVALAMPTFFGPTNIPVLEAWALDCPVLTSDIRGIREQVGDAAILADPRSVEALRDAIRSLWGDEQLRRSLVERGRRRLASYTRADYTARLTQILDTTRALVEAGRSN